MKITKPIIIFISSVAIIMALLVAPKPPRVQSVTPEYNRYDSFNIWLGFDYPKAWGDFRSQFPTVFESESITFNNGVYVNLGWHEGEFTGELVREKVSNKFGHDCTLYIAESGAMTDAYNVSAVCYKTSNPNKNVLVTVYSVPTLEKAQQHFAEFKNLVESI